MSVPSARITKRSGRPRQHRWRRPTMRKLRVCHQAPFATEAIDLPSGDQETAVFAARKRTVAARPESGQPRTGRVDDEDVATSVGTSGAACEREPRSVGRPVGLVVLVAPRRARDPALRAAVAVRRDDRDGRGQGGCTPLSEDHGGRRRIRNGSPDRAGSTPKVSLRGTSRASPAMSSWRPSGSSPQQGRSDPV
jgi:hypothetical protein